DLGVTLTLGGIGDPSALERSTVIAAPAGISRALLTHDRADDQQNAADHQRHEAGHRQPDASAQVAHPGMPASSSFCSRAISAATASIGRRASCTTAATSCAIG